MDTYDRRCTQRDLSKNGKLGVDLNGMVRTPLGAKKASLRVSSIRTGTAGHQSVACELLYTLFFSQTLNAYWQNTDSTCGNM